MTMYVQKAGKIVTIETTETNATFDKLICITFNNQSTIITLFRDYGM